MRTLKLCHIFVGALGIIIFVLTGQYMDIYLNHLSDLADGPRMLYRSSHIYFLLSCTINLCIAESIGTHKSYLKASISVVILVSPILLLIGFFIEPTLSEFHRPYTRPALYGLFGASILLILINLKQHFYK